MRKKHFDNRITAGTLVLAVSLGLTGVLAVPGTAWAQQSPEFAYSAEKWATLRDNRLEYDEIPDLIHEYNTTVLQNAIAYRDEKDKTRDDVAQEYYDAAESIYGNLEYPDTDDSDYGSRLAAALSNEQQAEQMLERGDESTEDSETIKMGYDQAEDNLVKQAQQQMIEYWSQYYNLDSVRKRKEQAEASLQSEQNRLAAGMSTQAKVLNASEAVSSAEASILTAKSSLQQAKERLCLMLGWSYGADVEIGALPEPDLDQIAAINVDADITTALANNYSLRLTEKRLANTRSTNVHDTLTETQRSQRETISNNVRNSYESLRLAESNYRQAQEAYEIAKNSLASAERGLQAGTVTRNSLQSQQTSCLTAETTVTTRKLSLLNAWVEYQWAVKGLASA